MQIKHTLYLWFSPTLPLKLGITQVLFSSMKVHTYVPCIPLLKLLNAFANKIVILEFAIQTPQLFTYLVR